MAKTGRNEPCPCGSGRKFKLCHGVIGIASVAPAVAPPAHSALGLDAFGAIADGTARERACGTCTACCEGWVEGEIRGHRMHVGRHCHFLDQGACTIYDERPVSPCRRFVCGWKMAGSPFPEAFRPDRVGFIIVPTRWRDRAAFVLVSAGRDPAGETLAWMEAYARRTLSPFFYQQGIERIGYGPSDFQHEMQARLQRGERLW